MKKFTMAASLMCALSTVAPSAKAAPIVQVVVAIDESGSMGCEQAWVGGMITTLATQLSNLGYAAEFGLVGFGNGINATANLGRMFDMGAGAGVQQFGTAAEFNVADNGLVTDGSNEDGYAALNFIMSNYTFTVGSIRNFILITDEDRDDLSNPDSVTLPQGVLLNAIVNNPFGCTGGGTGSVIGRTTSTGYRVNGTGGYTTCTSPTTGDGANNTETQYVPLALNSGGAAWNLEILRNGGNYATSFTKAFVDIKVQEITSGVPEPATWGMTALGLLGLGILRRKRAA